MGLLSGIMGSAGFVAPEELVPDDGKLLAEGKVIEVEIKAS